MYRGNRGDSNFNRSYRMINEIALMREANETAAREQEAKQDAVNDRLLPDVPAENDTEYSEDMPFN